MGTHRKPPPPICRSGDCGRESMYEIHVDPGEVLRPSVQRTEGRLWSGTFCRKHLLRVLPARTLMLGPKESLVINKIRGK